MNEKTFLMEHLWDIFAVAREERTDGDNFEGDLGTAPDLFLNGLTPEGKQYQCMEGLDKPALLERWAEEDQAASRAEYKAVVGHDLDHKEARRYEELTAAFTAGDREAFEAVTDGALAVLYAGVEPEGV